MGTVHWVGLSLAWHPATAVARTSLQHTSTPGVVQMSPSRAPYILWSSTTLFTLQ